MAIGLILLGAILIVVAFQDTQGQLAAALQEDVTGFFVWGLAVFAILAAGWWEPLRKPSHWLLGLVLLVIVLKNFDAIKTGLTGLETAAGSSATTAAGTTAGGGFNALDPASYLAIFGVG